jgi:hypothetical protein
MNDGYLFLIGCWLLLILIFTQWFDFLWEKDRVQRSRRWALFALLLLIAGQGIYIPVSDQVSLNLSMYGVMAFLFLIFFWKSDYRPQTLSVVLFIAVFYAVAFEVFYLDPILMILSPTFLLPAFFALFLLLTTSALKHQWLMLTGGTLIGEGLHKFFLLEHVTHVYLGDAAFRDLLLIGFIFTTGLQLLVHMTWRAFRTVVRLRQSEGNQGGS